MTAPVGCNDDTRFPHIHVRCGHVVHVREQLMRDIVCRYPQFTVGRVEEQVHRHCHEGYVHVTFDVQGARVVLVHAYGRGGRWAQSTGS